VVKKYVRQPIVVVLGHVDHGKCLHPDETVFLSDGRFIKISELFDESLTLIKEGNYEWIAEHIPIYTLTKEGRVEPKKTSYVWRVKYDGELIKVTLSDGSVVRVTPEHPFLTLKGWKRADKLSKDDYVAIPSYIPFNQNIRKLRETLIKLILRKLMKLKNNEVMLKLGHNKYVRFKDLINTGDEGKILNTLYGVREIVISKEKGGKEVIKVPITIEEWRIFFQALCDYLRSKQRKSERISRASSRGLDMQESKYMFTLLSDNLNDIEGVELPDFKDLAHYFGGTHQLFKALAETMQALISYGMRSLLLLHNTLPLVKFLNPSLSDFIELSQYAPLNLLKYLLRTCFPSLIFKKPSEEKPFEVSITLPERRELMLIKWLLLRIGVVAEYAEISAEGRVLGVLKVRGKENLLRLYRFLYSIELNAKMRRKMKALTVYIQKLIELIEEKVRESREPYVKVNWAEDIVFVKVKDISRVRYSGYLYDLSVDDTQNFIVNGVIVHNTTLLDKIRGTAVVKKEAGEMTQHVGASVIPADVIEKIAQPLKKIIPFQLKIPGLLFIDTPGHEIFSNLRRRGGSVADFAILVIDVIEGVQRQTIESIEILRERRVPFVVAANKIDRIYGWRSNPDTPFLITMRRQDPSVLARLDEYIYRIVADLAKLGFNADRFDKVRDFTRTLAIVPVSAKTGEGIPELLAILAGLTQKYLIGRLEVTVGPAKGVVLEVKEITGLGTCMDVIIYDGVLKKGDLIVVAGKGGPITTRVRSLLMPKPLEEIRVAGTKFMSVNEVSAAAGVRVVAPNLEDALAGSPLYVVPSTKELPTYISKVIEEVKQIRFSKNIDGVVVKADTLGTLEAVVQTLEKKGIPVRLADVGPLSKREVIEASIVAKSNKYLGVILLFNVKPLPDAEELVRKEGIPVFSSNIVYKLIESYEEWVAKEKEREKLAQLAKLVRPGKIRVLPGYIFRRSNPAIVGIEVLGGVIRPGYPLMREDGRRLGEIMQIQERGKALPEARVGQAVAISIRGNVLVGRHFDEGDILYTDMPERDVVELVNKFRSELSDDEIMVLKEIIAIKRKKRPTFALSVQPYLK